MKRANNQPWIVTTVTRHIIIGLRRRLRDNRRRLLLRLTVRRMRRSHRVAIVEFIVAAIVFVRQIVRHRFVVVCGHASVVTATLMRVWMLLLLLLHVVGGAAHTIHIFLILCIVATVVVVAEWWFANHSVRLLMHVAWIFHASVVMHVVVHHIIVHMRRMCLRCRILTEGLRRLQVRDWHVAFSAISESTTVRPTIERRIHIQHLHLLALLERHFGR
mmetsp:Transcript_34685/g.56543  ORF Transcript_34685/g.56543 Transcript_34685/m.56543 type:complete len:217 (-) Transcript_34685:115-765(-)